MLPSLSLLSSTSSAVLPKPKYRSSPLRVTSSTRCLDTVPMLAGLFVVYSPEAALDGGAAKTELSEEPANEDPDLLSPARRSPPNAGCGISRDGVVNGRR